MSATSPTYSFEEVLQYLNEGVYPVAIRHGLDDSKNEKREKDNKKRSLRKYAASFRVVDGKHIYIIYWFLNLST